MEQKTSAVVSGTPKASLEQILATIPLEGQRILDQKVSDIHLDEIARSLIKWNSVCTKLTISEAEEEAIKEENRSTDERRLAVLRKWRSKYGPTATYRNLSNCFFSVDKLEMVETVCQVLGAPSSSVMTEQQDSDDSPVHRSIASSCSQKQRDECSNTSTASGTNAKSVDILSRQPPFQQLSPSEQEELKAMLDDDVREMKQLFGCLFTETRDSVEERITVRKLAGSILALGAYEPAPEERNPSLLDEHKEEINSAKTVSEIFNILNAYWNYITYDILEYIIKLYGTSDDKEKLTKYNRELQKFCERRIFELPECGTGTGNAVSPGQERFNVKLDVREDITGKDLLRIRKRISKILHVNLATLIIDRVDVGCVQLTFLIPKFVAQEIFPLSDEQASALKDALVIRLECGGYIFKNTRETSTKDQRVVSSEAEELEDNNVSAEGFSKHHQGQVSESIKHIRPVEETAVKTQEHKEFISTPTETQYISDEEWDPPVEFAIVLAKIAEVLNKTTNVEVLKNVLEFLCHPRTGLRYIDVELYKHCVTPRDIIKALSPQYINFMHTHLLRKIVTNFGNEQSITLLRQYEDKFPCKKPLKQMRDPLTIEEMENCHGSKRIEIVCNPDSNVDNTTRVDVERVQQIISRNTGIDVSVIVYAHQTPGSVVFTFLIPEMVVSSVTNLDDDSQTDLAKHGILRIEVNNEVIDLQSLQPETKTNTSQPETKAHMSQAEANTNTLQPEIKTDISLAEASTSTLQPAIKTDTSLAETSSNISQPKTDTNTSQSETRNYISTYTISGMKRVPLTHDSPKATHCNSEFQQLISDVGTSLAETVEVSQLKEFLQGFSHILYPESQYIDPSVLNNADSIFHIFTALQPQFINFLNWGILRKTADAFDIEIAPAYKIGLPSDTPLSTLPDPQSEKEISEFKIVQKLRVTRGGGSGIEWTLADVQAVKEAMEKATGIDQDFIIYAYWEGGFSTHQFTFLIPKCISVVFWELCEEDLAILAGIGVQRLEIDYRTVADDIHELYPQTVAPIRPSNRLETKNFGLEHFIPEDEAERMSEEDFGHLNELITNIPAGKFQETCSNDALKVLAKKMGSWKDLAPYLGINQWDLEDLATMYPGDEQEQRYVALLNWKSIDVNSATYERLVECLLTHGHVGDAKELLLYFQGPEVQKAQKILQQRFLEDSFSKRKLWFAAPRLPKFNRRLGIVQNAPLLSELDYTSCYEMMDQFPSEIQELSMKSMLNNISRREGRVFILKGPPGCGKTELISRVCRYWSRLHTLRKFSLVLYVNIWDFHQGCTLSNLIDRQFIGSTVSTKKICRWIEEVEGSEILFILDGFCRKYLYRSPLQKGKTLSDILCGHSCFSKSMVVISTTCSDFIKPLCENFIQFEILGLSDEQIGKQVLQHFGSERAVNFLSYLAENPEIKALVSSPSYLIGTMYVFAHIPYDDLPVTWSELHTSLVVLISEWHKKDLPHDSLLTNFKNMFLRRGRKVSKDFSTNSLQSQFQNTLLANSRKVIKDSRDLITTVGRLLIHNAEDNDHELPDHNSAVPYLDYFLFSLRTFLNPGHKKLDTVLKDKDAFTYFWYKKNVLQTRFGSGYVTAVLSSITAEVGVTVVTTHDMLSFIHCLPYMQDSHTIVLNKSFLGTQAAGELSRFLAADSWINNYSGITHLW